MLLTLRSHIYDWHMQYVILSCDELPSSHVLGTGAQATYLYIGGFKQFFFPMLTHSKTDIESCDFVFASACLQDMAVCNLFCQCVFTG